MEKSLNASVTITVKAWVTLSDGAPSSNTTMRMTLVLGPWSEFGLQVKTPPAALMDALSDFSIVVGTTNVLKSQPGSVPLFLNAGIALTNVSFTLEADPSRLTNLVLTPVASELSVASLQPIGLGTYQVRMETGLGQSLVGNRPIAVLGFAATDNSTSSIVRVHVSSIVGRAGGISITNGSASDGRIFFLGREPLLDMARGVRGNPQLFLFGRPGGSFLVEARTNLGAGSAWIRIARVPLTNSTHPVPIASQGEPAVFYRAAEFFADPAELDVPRVDAGVFGFTLYGLAGITYQVQSSTNPLAPASWLPLRSVQLTNSFQAIQDTNVPGPIRVFRVLKQ